jgi:hypothetical protein
MVDAMATANRVKNLIDKQAKQERNRQRRPRSFSEVVDRFGGDQRLADTLRVARVVVAAWKHRDSIPPAYWEQIIEVARARDMLGITMRSFVELAARVRKQS